MDEYWYDYWFYIKDQNIAPILIGEWGGFMEGDNLTWMTYLRELIGENHLNYCVLATSADDGRSWKEVLIADPDGAGLKRSFDPEVWIAPDGKLRWTWTDRCGPVQADAAFDQLWMATLDPETGDVLEAPRRIASGVSMRSWRNWRNSISVVSSRPKKLKSRGSISRSASLPKRLSRST